jgi:hypothetical protein
VNAGGLTPDGGEWARGSFDVRSGVVRFIVDRSINDRT